MTQEKIIEGNKLIELFYSGRTLSTDDTFFGRKQGMPKQYENWYDIVSVGDLKYHSSWDWLMPVVDKVEQLFEGSISVNIYDDRCTIEISTQYAMATDIHLPDEFYNNEGPKIRSTWLSIVQFITWYNTQNP